MSKLLEGLRNLPDIYYNLRKTNEDLQKILNYTDETTKHMNEFDKKLDELDRKADDTQAHMREVDEKINNMTERLKIIGKGTKMELFDTLYHWKKILVDDRGWASPAEKKEVKEIYEVYHDGLHGNGQGEVYYNQIAALPEVPPTNN